jgi:hypothetical protein
MDVVLSAIDSYEDWYNELWKEWIERREREEPLEQSFAEVPQVAQAQIWVRLSPLLYSKSWENPGRASRIGGCLGKIHLG